VRESESGARFSRDVELHIVELDRLRRHGPTTPSTRWLQFIANAEHWDEVPAGLSSPLLEKAMNVLDRINTHQRDVYEARLNEERRRIDQEAETAAAKAWAEAEARAEAPRNR
jgi:hypothetical protein